MSKKIISTILILTSFSILILQYSHAKAGDYRLKRIDSMKIQQALLIDKGIKSGRITANESKLLLSEKRQIRKTENGFRKDKHLSSYEISIIIKLLNKAMKNIQQEINDDERRPIRSKHGKMHH